MTMNNPKHHCYSRLAGTPGNHQRDGSICRVLINNSIICVVPVFVFYRVHPEGRVLEGARESVEIIYLRKAQKLGTRGGYYLGDDRFQVRSRPHYSFTGNKYEFKLYFIIIDLYTLSAARMY